MFTSLQTLIQAAYLISIVGTIWAALSNKFNDGFLGKAALAVASIAGYVGLIQPQRHCVFLIVLMGLLFAIIRHLFVTGWFKEHRK